MREAEVILNADILAFIKRILYSVYFFVKKKQSKSFIFTLNTHTHTHTHTYIYIYIYIYTHTYILCLIVILAFCDSARQRELNNVNNKIDFLDLVCHDSIVSSSCDSRQMAVVVAGGLCLRF